MKQSKKKINCILSDMHCGSDRAIFPPVITLPKLMADDNERTLRYSNNQKRIYDHLMSCAKHIKTKFKDHQKIIIHNGDAIEGNHHRTIQLSAPMVDDHVLIHQQVMEEFLYEVGFSVKNGDELHYSSGTEVHTGYTESSIVDYFESYGAKFHDELKLNQYGRNIWFVHEWSRTGDGQNEGSPITNKLKSMYFNSIKEGWKMPDYTVGSHYHKAVMASFTIDWQTFYGMITPSFQMKTRFGQKVSAFQRNDIGMGLIEVAPEGMMFTHKPLLMSAK